jgi:type IV pilus assembly protein PilE
MGCCNHYGDESMNRYPRTPGHAAGFTLIELLIAVTILGVISAYAFSSYQKSIQKSGRAEAKAAVTQTAAALEQWRFAHSTYVASAVASVYTTSAYTPKTPNQFYTVTITASASTYTISASALSTARQYKDTDCRTFTLNNLGIQAAKNSGGTTTTTTCW